jgi:dihydrofolate reductase
MTMSIVVAMSENRVIGSKNDIPWRIPGEQKIFRRLTIGRNLIMGRKTHESIGRVLPDRTTIIITRQHDYAVPGAHVVHSLEEALDLAKRLGGDIAIGGGGELFAQTLPLVDTVYLTTIHAEFEGDVLFPELPEGNFRRVTSEEIDASIPYTFAEYERIR